MDYDDPPLRRSRNSPDPFWTLNNMLECHRFLQNRRSLEHDEETRKAKGLLSIAERKALTEKERTSVQRYERDYLTIEECKYSLHKNVRQKSEVEKPKSARLYGAGHGRRFDVVRAYRLYEAGILRSLYIRRLTEAFAFRDPATARRWVKQMEDQGYFRRVGSPARLEPTDKTDRLGGWRKGKEAIQGAVAAMPENVRRVGAARRSEYLRARGWLIQKGWNFQDGIDRWYDGTREDGIFYFLEDHALHIQRQRDGQGKE